MRNPFRSTLALCAVLLGALASVAAAAVAIPCADYLTTSIDDEPASGHLIGTETRKEIINGGFHFTPGGMGSTVGGSVEVSWEVGYYDFGNGITAIDCRTYQAVA